MIEIEELCAANGLTLNWKVKMPHVELSGNVDENTNVSHDNKFIDNPEKS